MTKKIYKRIIGTVLLNLISIFSNAQGPAASFKTDQTIGSSPLTIQFTNTSVNASSYYWDFGNGNISVLTNPTNVYSNTGTYIVKLIAISANGQKDSVISSNLITVSANAISNFYAVNTSSCLDGNSFSFVNTSLNSTTCLWDFGDGNTSTLHNATHSYSSQGNYTIKLISYNSFGYADLKIMTNYIHVTPKPANTFTVNTTTSCNLNQIFNFTSTAPSANSWLWNFGDGTISTLSNPQHSYNNAGIYSVSLITSNGGGCVDSLIKNNYISISDNQIPSFTASTTSECTLLPISFTNTSDDTKSCLWDFGDSGTSTLQNPSHIYKNSGNYNISLTVTTNSNCTYTTTLKNKISIQNNAVSNFSLNNKTGCAPLNVQFTNLSKNDSSRLWEFGDGTTSTLQNPSHIYTENDKYTVILHSYSASGCSSVYTQTNAVIISPPVADFSANIGSSCGPIKASFKNSSTNSDQWLWNFGDSTTSTLKNPVHTYNSAGDYDVTLIAYDVQGCSDTLTRNSFVEVNNSVDNYVPPPTITGCVPLNVSFEKATQGAISWLWDFGDGTTSKLKNPSHTFITSGSFTVSLTIQLNSGCTQVYPKFETFEVQGGSAEFTFTRTACSPYVVNFKDSTNAKATSWFWDFGDNSTSILQNPTHTYPTTEFYTVIHKTITPIGCKSEIIQSNLIHFTACAPPAISSTPPPPFLKGGSSPVNIIQNGVITGAIHPLSGCIPLLVNFHNIIPNTISWFWNFGDGTTSTLENPIHSYIKDGNFDVMMIAKNAIGKRDTIIYSKYIHASGVTTNFSFTQNSNCVNTTLAFTDSSKNAISWLWNFGDGATDTLKNPTHVYSGSGKNYTIQLTTSNADGCLASMSSNFSNVLDNPVVKANKYVVCNNQSVNFTCSSSNSGSYQWDFGDGTTSTLKNPSHIYLTDGSFQVILKLTNSNGCTRNFSLPHPIVSQNPIADFTSILKSGCNSTAVNFSNLSIGSALPLSSHSRWDFGDASPTQWIENPMHTYTQPGTYHVKLLVNNDKKCINNTMKIVNVYPTTVADFSSSQNTTCFPITVTYNDSSTKAVSWLWDFGDGTTSILQNPIHIFTVSPTSGVKLIITDANGCQANITKPNISIFNTDFSISKTKGCAPMNVTFSDLSINASEWLWNFGDGTISTIQNPSHIYLNEGIYPIILISKTVTGCLDTMTFNSLNLNKPTANFISKNPTNCSPTVVSFTDLSTEATSWLWDFGDGSSSVNQHPAHIYNIPGLYTIKLIVKNSEGCTDTLTRIDYIKVPGTIANFGTSAQQFCAQSVIQFTDSSINASSWNWNFGDGNSSSLQHPANHYQNPGQYSVSLIVRDSFGCTSSFTLANPIIVNPLPTSNFTISDTVFCSPFSVSFYNHSQNSFTYLWDFGDGDTSTLYNPSHTYLNSGTYTASLIATNEFGCSDTSRYHSITANKVPVIDFTANVTEGCSEMSISFIDASSSISNGNYFWDFGNGKTSIKQNDSTTFINPGNYTVSLIVSDNKGCRDTAIKSSFIEIADFNPPAESNILCATVISDNTTYLIWEPSNASDFAYYKIYRKDILTGDYFSIGIINDISIVSISDTNLNTLANSYCYKVRTFDKCGYALPLDSLLEHCTINITAKGVNDHIKVSWTPYVGASLGTYSIYRMETAEATPELIAIVPSNVLTVIDTTMYCPTDFSYRIKANKLNGNFICSNSDTSIAKPVFNILSQQKVEIVRSTVINNSGILTEWNTPAIAPKAVTEYSIYRSTDNINFSFLTTVTSLVHEYIDNDVDVNAKNYYYKIEAKNSCGIVTLGSNKSSSILLKAELINGDVMLNWTKYEEWNTGVDHFIIEKMNEQEEWKIVKTVDGNQLISEVE